MHKKGIIVCSVFGVLVLGALYSGASFAAQTCTTDEQTGQVTCTNSATASVTVAAACSFSRTSGSGEYTGILANNASVEVTGSTFSTTCNDSGGYAIYAIGYGNNTFGNTDLIFDNDPDNANKITTSSNPGSNTSYWQMKLAAGAENQPVLENGYGGYSAVPSTYTKVASYASADMGTAQTVTATYRAAASATQPAGTYTGAVKYTMVHPGTITAPSICPANSICYSPNADGTVNGSMGNQTIASDATSATLLASNFWRTGYGFAGWNTEYDGSGTFYGPNEDIEFEAGQYGGTNGGLSLYAVWVKSTGYLQDWNGCQTLTRTTYNSETSKLVAGLSSITALTDKRDNQTYAVARLADGNCWMIENLRLDTAGTVGNNINDPSVTNQSLAQGYGGVFNGLADSETANFANSTVMNKLGDTNFYGTDGSGATNIIDAASHRYSNTNYVGYYFPRYRNTNTASPASSPTGNGGNMYSYGNYYTWTAAMANTTFYRSYNGAANTDTGSDAANTSICPKGWRLPLGASRNTIDLSFSKLDKQMGGTGDGQSSTAGTTQSKVWRSFPNNFLYSGGVGSSIIFNRGLYGRYWSSSADNANDAYLLYLDGSGLRPGTDNNYKPLGFAVRCVVGS